MREFAPAVRRLFPEPAYQVGCGGSHIWLHRAEGAGRFIIIGVQKPRIKRSKRTPEVWQSEVMPAPGLIEQGRKKYERLLKAHAQVQRPAAAAD